MGRKPAEDHLPRVEDGGRRWLTDHAPLHRAVGKLNLDFPVGRLNGADGETGPAQMACSEKERRDDIARGLGVRGLPAPGPELLVADQGVSPCNARRARSILCPAQPLESRPKMGLVFVRNVEPAQSLMPELSEHRPGPGPGVGNRHGISREPAKWSRIHRVSRCPASCSPPKTQRAPAHARTVPPNPVLNRWSPWLGSLGLTAEAGAPPRQ